MQITWQDVAALAPELANLDPATQTEILQTVARQVPDDTWDTDAPDGQKYLAAHLGVLSVLGGSGAVTSESVGPLSRSYSTTRADIPGDYGLTSFGVRFYTLSRQLVSSVGGLTL